MNTGFFSGLSKQQLIILGIGGAVILFVILAITGIIPIFKSSQGTDPNFPTGKVTLQMWGVGDEGVALAAAVGSYQSQTVSQNVSVNYTKFDSVDVYETALIKALAERRGPDLFMVKNTWIPKDATKLAVATSTLVTPLMVQQAFAPAVYTDMVLADSAGQKYVYALPLHFDALALIYNKDMFNARGVVYPPTTWDEVVRMISLFREVDAQKNITTSPIALGGARTISNFDNVLSLLMLQSGASITGQNGMLLDGPAQQAISFYMQFANPTNVYYSWNDLLGDSRSAFAAQKTAMIIDTHSALMEITKKNSFINAGVAQVPQLSTNAQDAKTLASYWGIGVSRQSAFPYVAWHFARFLTMTPNVNAAYLQATNKLPALLSLINAGINGENGVLLKNFLIAKTWWHKDDELIQNAWSDMLDNIASGKTSIMQGARAAQDEVNAQ